MYLKGLGGEQENPNENDVSYDLDQDDELNFDD